MNVGPLPARRLGEASRLLGRAFAADPFIGHFLRGRRGRIALTFFFDSALSALQVFGATDDGKLFGVAAWAPPGAANFVSRRARSRMLVVRVLCPRGARRLLAAFDVIAAAHPEAPHWYLAFVGIEPAAQGRGIGSALLAPVLDRNELCYLETPFEGTHAFYRRLGFEHIAELRPVAGAPPVWTMTRPASS